MRLGILGTGGVSRTLAGALDARGDEVVLGTRDPAASRTAEPLAAFLAAHRDATLTTFEEAARSAELVILAVGGEHAVDVVTRAGAVALADKVLIDVTNPLDFSAGFPPTLFACNTTSLGEQVQAATPARVVKVLNTVAASVMVDPLSVANGDHDLFICGDDEEAKRSVTTLLQERFGWTSFVDLGDITMSRGSEMYLALWTRLMAAVGTHEFNIRVVR